MDAAFDLRYPSIEHLRARARRRLPRFVYEYLDGGCHTERNLRRNTEELREIQVLPRYLQPFAGSDLQVELFGERYAAPFGIAPIGLQGLIWPRATEILAETAAAHQLPFVLSTVATADIETVARITGGKAWFQLYHPTEDDLRDKLLARAAEAGLSVLVLLADTPVFGYRPKEIRNGLSLPPRMTLRNILQMMCCPAWSLRQLAVGPPEFANLTPYIPRGLDMRHLGEFMNRTFSGRLSPDRIAAIRERWKGKLVIKGVVTEADADLALSLGVDGLIVSNHGGRQLDNGPSAIHSLCQLAERYADRTTLMLDSGLRSGPDIGAALACGARLVFLGRSFLYGLGALGERGGEQVATMLERQLRQWMEQIGCARVEDIPAHLDKESLPW